MLAAGLHGFLLKPMPYWLRGFAIAAALMLVAPELTTDIIGFVLMTLVIAVQYYRQPTPKLVSVGAAAADRAQDRRS